MLAVEPNSIAASILRENIRLNSLDNVTVLEKAINRVSGSARLYKTPVISTWTLEGDANQGYVNVVTATLDELLYPYTRVDALKVDAEGAEIGILEGGQEALKKVWTIVIEARTSNVARVEDLLRQSGFVTKELEAESGIVLILGKRN